MQQKFLYAQFTFDKFNFIKIIHDKVDYVLREEQPLRAELKSRRFVWVKNAQNLKATQRRQTNAVGGECFRGSAPQSITAS